MGRRSHERIPFTGSTLIDVASSHALAVLQIAPKYLGSGVRQSAARLYGLGAGSQWTGGNSLGLGWGCPHLPDRGRLRRLGDCAAVAKKEIALKLLQGASAVF